MMCYDRFFFVKKSDNGMCLLDFLRCLEVVCMSKSHDIYVKWPCCKIFRQCLRSLIQMTVTHAAHDRPYLLLNRTGRPCRGHGDPFPQRGLAREGHRMRPALDCRHRAGLPGLPCERLPHGHPGRLVLRTRVHKLLHRCGHVHGEEPRKEDPAHLLDTPRPRPGMSPLRPRPLGLQVRLCLLSPPRRGCHRPARPCSVPPAPGGGHSLHLDHGEHPQVYRRHRQEDRQVPCAGLHLGGRIPVCRSHLPAQHQHHHPRHPHPVHADHPGRHRIPHLLFHQVQALRHGHLRFTLYRVPFHHLRQHRDIPDRYRHGHLVDQASRHEGVAGDHRVFCLPGPGRSLCLLPLAGSQGTPPVLHQHPLLCQQIRLPQGMGRAQRVSDHSLQGEPDHPRHLPGDPGQHVHTGAFHLAAEGSRLHGRLELSPCFR